MKFSLELIKYAEAVVQKCSIKKVFLKFLQNSQENTCARVSLWQSCGPAALWKRDSGAGVFLWIFRNFQEHLFYRTPPVVASEYEQMVQKMKSEMKKTNSFSLYCKLCTSSWSSSTVLFLNFDYFCSVVRFTSMCGYSFVVLAVELSFTGSNLVNCFPKLMLSFHSCYRIWE